MFVFDTDRPTVESTARGIRTVTEALAVNLRKRVDATPPDALTPIAKQMLLECETIIYHALKLDKLNGSPS